MRPRTGSALAALAALLLAPVAAGPEDEPPDTPRDRPGSLSWSGWQRDLSLRVVLDRKEAWVGEQVTAALELVSPVEVVDWDTYKPPALEGFWVEDLGVKPSRRIERVDGVPVRVYLLKKLALFPHRAGTLPVEAAELEVRVQIASRGLGLLNEVRRARRASRPVSVRVKPLPPGPPPGFSPGNVGDWSLSLEVPDGPQPAGQPFAVRLVARGTGNLRALALPRLPPAAGLEAFEPLLADQPKLAGDRLGGSRSLETPVALEREGTVELSEVDWAWFDPRAGRYRTVRLPPVRLQAGPPPAVPGPSVAESAEWAALLRPLRTEGTPLPRREPPWRGGGFLALLLLGPLAFAGLAMGARLRARRALGEIERRRRGAGRLATRRTRAARLRMEAGDPAGFHAELSRALLGYAADRLGEPVAGLTREDLAARLVRAGVSAPAAGRLVRALEGCDAGRFGGASAMPELLGEAEEALARLERGGRPSGEAR